MAAATAIVDKIVVFTQVSLGSLKASRRNAQFNESDYIDRAGSRHPDDIKADFKNKTCNSE